MRSAPKRYLVSIAIALLLFALVLWPTGSLDPNPTGTTRTRLLNITQASQSYHHAYGVWPAGLAALSPEHNSLHIAFLPSGKSTTKDAWGRPLLYKPFDPALGYGTVMSLGRDGKPGGEGNDGDMEERFR